MSSEATDRREPTPTHAPAGDDGDDRAAPTPTRAWARTAYVLDHELYVVVGDLGRAGAGDERGGSVVHVPADTLHTFAVVTGRSRYLTITHGQAA